MNVIIEISARHLHLSPSDQDALFGPGYEMKKMKDISQRGQWAAEEKVRVIGPKGELDCRVLGPCRPKTQVELSATDALTIGLSAPARLSGDLAGAGACALVGPKGSVEIAEGVIVALRHLHVPPDEAEKLGLKSGDVIAVDVAGPRGAFLRQVHVRVHESFQTRVHLDTDEANAVGLEKGVGQGDLITSQSPI